MANILVDWVWPLLLFIIGLGLVIFVHELGHFLVAKWAGIKVERFALGFGPNILAFRRGETEYCLKAFPLGGYVKMLGQEDFKPMDADEKPDPRAYNAKPIGVRLAVISAGVVMNVIFGAILFIAVCMIGIRMPAPVVGLVMPGSPADTAVITWSEPMSQPADPAATGASRPANRIEGLKPGDRIISIDGEPAITFQDIAVKSVLAGSGDKFRFEIERLADGNRPVRGVATVGLQKTLIPGAGRVNSFGIMPAQDTVFGEIENLITDIDIKTGDRLVAINGQPVKYNWQIDRIEKELDGRPIKASILRKDGSGKIDLTIRPSVKNGEQFIVLKDGRILRGRLLGVENGKVRIGFEDNTEKSVPREDIRGENLDILGMIPRVEVRALHKDSPADKAGLRPGDIIVDYGERDNPPTMDDIHQLNKEAVEKNGLKITILRDGKILSPLVVPEKRNGGDPIIGILTDSDIGSCVLSGVRKESAAAKGGLQPGDTITAINDVPVKSWVDLLHELKNFQGKDVKLTYVRGGKPETADMGLLTPEIYQPQDYRFDLSPAFGAFEGLEITVVKYNPLDALAWGVSETWRIILTTYASIHRLITRDVSTEAVRGPIGIGSAAIMTVRRSFMHLVYLMAFLSVAVAVMNFLPFPVFDGGHAFFLILEKLRGKPLPLKVMNAIQMCGLILILGLLVAVTWQDVARAIRGIW
ncbi:MAG: RIP metalloprotease RseP [Planctomycetes bacterium]|nr:RIP metalloprotease RseP [Planctomycetota bacterium]